jgi:hypothetical protein
MRHAIGTGLIFAGVSLALACAPSTSPLDLAGRYALISVNGQPLPYLLPGGGTTRVELLEDTFNFNPGGTYSEAGYRRMTSPTGISFSFPVDAGHLRRRGDQLRLESLIFPLRTATISHGEIRMVDQQLMLVYRKT